MNILSYLKDTPPVQAQKMQRFTLGRKTLVASLLLLQTSCDPDTLINLHEQQAVKVDIECLASNTMSIHVDYNLPLENQELYLELTNTEDSTFYRRQLVEDPAGGYDLIAVIDPPPNSCSGTFQITQGNQVKHEGIY